MSRRRRWEKADRRAAAYASGKRSVGPGVSFDGRDARNRELVADAQAGDLLSLDELLRENEPLLHAIVLDLARSSRARAWIEELLQEARLALHEAVATYDPTKGARFSTWLAWKVRPRAQRLFSECLYAVSIAHDVFGVAFLGHQLERDVNPDLIEAARAHKCALTITEEKRGADDGNVPPGHILSDHLPAHAPEQEVAVERSRRIALAEAAISCLSPRDADIVKRRVIDDDDLQVIADAQVPKISRERVRQIVESSLPKMRRAVLRFDARGELDTG